MLRSYFIIAIRSLRKHAAVSFINIIGLAFGMSAFLIIVQYVLFQLSYDNFHENKESIYRVESRFFKNGVMTDDWPSSSGGYGPAMKREFPEITQFARIYLWGGDRIVSRDDIRHREKNVYIADPELLDIFSFKLINGNPASALKEPNSVILSQSAAQKYFGDQDPVGKTLKLSNTESVYECAVTGVFDDVPANSHIDFDILISWATLSSRWPGVDEFWYQHEAYTYVRLAPHSNVASIEERFPMLAEKHKTLAAMKDMAWGIKLVPLTAIHLNPLKSYEREVKGSKIVVWVLACIAGLILFIAWINYINLTSARALERAKEVAIRKTAGAKKMALFYQFLFESTLVNAISLLLAMAIVNLSMPYFVELSGVDFRGTFTGNTVMCLLLGLFFMLGVFFSGLYPALVIAAFHPVTALKGKITQSVRGKAMRKSLVVFQFAISMVLIAISVVVFQQVEFMRNQDMGMETEQILVVRTPSATENYDARLETLRNTFLQSSEVSHVTVSSAVPGKEVAMFLSNRNAEQHTEENRLYEMLRTDHDFVNTYQLQLLQGRNFSRNIPTDRFAVILNEESVKQLGYIDNESALNKEVYLEGRDDKFKIIGVVKNFHQTSLKNKFTPIMLFISPDYSWIPLGYISLHVKSKDWPQTIHTLQQSWTKTFPESSFDYFFLDDFIDQQYRADLAFGKLVGIFCFLAIGIACLGLLGQASYDTLLRRKEVGIRKVLGATVPQLLKLLSKDLVALIVAAYALSVPLAYFIASAWLESYSFKMSMNPWMFIIPLLILLPIAFLTVGSQTIKVASSNPIDSLRSE